MTVRNIMVQVQSDRKKEIGHKKKALSVKIISKQLGMDIDIP